MGVWPNGYMSVDARLKIGAKVKMKKESALLADSFAIGI
jgi:hypothetical protein